MVALAGDTESQLPPEAETDTVTGAPPLVTEIGCDGGIAPPVTPLNESALALTASDVVTVSVTWTVREPLAAAPELTVTDPR